MTRILIALCLALATAVAAVEAQDTSKTKAKDRDTPHLVFLDSSPTPSTIGVPAVNVGVTTNTILTTADERPFIVAIDSNGFPDTPYPLFGPLPGYYTTPDCTGQRYGGVSQVAPLVPGAEVRNQMAFIVPEQAVGTPASLGIISQAVAGFGGTTCQAFTPAPGPELHLGIPTEIDLSQYGFVPPFRAEIR